MGSRYSTGPVSDAVQHIRRINGSVNAYVNTRLPEALDEAQGLAAEPPRSPLHGLPYGLKDEWETLDLPTTGGSFRHRERRSPRDSSVFEAFREAGAVLVGKTNLSDLGLAPESNNHVVGPTRNPWDPDRTAGGSSGGAAAAVASGMQAFDWGTDIGGSIRQPAAFCGIFGMRLSSATWPLEDLFPVVPGPVKWMCGQGPLTRSTEHMRAVLEAAAPRVRRSSPPFEARRPLLFLPGDLRQWPTFVADVSPHLEAAFGRAVARDGELPSAERIRTTYSAVWASHLEHLVEADATLSLGEALRATFAALTGGAGRGDKRFHRDGAELLALMSLGRVTLFRNGRRALEEAERLRERVTALWSEGFVLVAPVSTGPAPRHGKGNRDHSHVLCCTALGNLADSTALAIPFGSFGHLPRALQLMGPPGSEAVLLDLADRLVASRDTDPALRPRAWPFD